MIVVDANVALSWVLPDTEERHLFSADVAAAGMAGEALIAPVVFPAECSYVLLKKGRQNRWGAVKTAECAEIIDLFRIELYQIEQNIAEQVRFALHRHVQGYDALYLALALQTGARIATHDNGLRAAARAARATLFSS
ncbi:type II toxin-antitoxin system VapC family toxin [Azohydromonas aeria]|uniref:type II toxin-antitoxin system VapC family toxin n=1 Tax=Azohydromonas aeria TaxID=2590212 RepID=UPI0012F90979|nr:type II toxin-antitoxin system VapC family toxin [Azohydromonas aeria]